MYLQCLCYATYFSCTGPSSGNTFFREVYSTVHLVEWYSLRHVFVVNFDAVECFSSCLLYYSRFSAMYLRRMFYGTYWYSVTKMGIKLYI
jgi:hypothetical protein